MVNMAFLIRFSWVLALHPHFSTMNPFAPCYQDFVLPFTSSYAFIMVSLLFPQFLYLALLFFSNQSYVHHTSKHWLKFYIFYVLNHTIFLTFFSAFCYSRCQALPFRVDSKSLPGMILHFFEFLLRSWIAGTFHVANHLLAIPFVGRWEHARTTLGNSLPMFSGHNI